MNKIIIAGNWKMHGSKQQLEALVHDIANQINSRSSSVDVVLFAPFPYLSLIEQACHQTGFTCGAQTMSEFPEGAYTGEVSGSMLRDVGCRAVLLGHSERRHVFGEANSMIAAKFVQAQSCGLLPILCVGETLAEREADKTMDIIKAQLTAVIDKAGVAALADSVIAYEPVWAIGTGKTATPEQAQAVHAEIRQFLAHIDKNIAKDISILYGGSVKSANAPDLLAMPDINGLLVGGASLVAESFAGIINAAIALRG